MAAQSPVQPQFAYDSSTPPPPPPKPAGHSSGRGTPAAVSSPGPPPPPHNNGGYDAHTAYHSPPPPPLLPQQGASSSYTAHALPAAPPPDWLPDVVKQQSTADLASLAQDPELQRALLNHAPSTHPSVPASNGQLADLLAANLQLAAQLTQLEAHLRQRRAQTQTALLSLRALERQWRAKQAEQDAVLRDFSAPALYQRLVAAVGEGDDTCRAMEESFLHTSSDRLGEREVQDFVRRYREARKVAFLRRERKERWDEGRVGGWR